MREILVPSTLDGSVEPSLFYKAAEEGRPLLVGLHTWSFDRSNQKDSLLPIAKRLGFNLLLPEFRGPNLVSNPRATEACASELAMRDIKDAIDYVINNEGVDAENIFLLGLSGGGHMALMMAGYIPEYFKAVGAFVPICDLEEWCDENANYAPHVRACCADSTEQMKKRSPISYIDNIARANVKIFHGKFDPVVPVFQSERLYSEIRARYPDARVFFDVFDGGHEIDLNAAEYWFMTQYKGKNVTRVTG